MSKTVNLNVRIQPEIKNQAEEILNDLGLSASTAINIFYRQIIEQQGLPFEVKHRDNNNTLSKESIYQEIDKGLKSYLEGKVTPVERVLEELKQEYNNTI
ncbi:type II toxin-antitoxin system RelB/DinJ family antitoxin [Fundicoccus culcitae]|uniref:Type II toxin-antitoxin system RelB/DinJ family antitoxin n=1 Tax=Fundicoccus culcitae TaxID=2969821 RepID=A0ABY5P4B5_9LACT|nr:type II toxin-antitoxin system RelB/DinJ family antitoxin [Fundicoccus culcitae]UUX33389.1 type II toxin-antitoxin system RelB/DinJ family antitoxin [Fundicoccus culcitae]